MVNLPTVLDFDPLLAKAMLVVAMALIIFVVFRDQFRVVYEAGCSWTFRALNHQPPLGTRPRVVLVGDWSLADLEEFLTDLSFSWRGAGDREVLLLTQEPPDRSLREMILWFNSSLSVLKWMEEGQRHPMTKSLDRISCYSVRDLRQLFVSASGDVSQRMEDAIVILNNRHSTDWTRADQRALQQCQEVKTAAPGVRIVVQVLLSETRAALAQVLEPQDDVVCLQDLLAWLLAIDTCTPGAASLLASLPCSPKPVLRSVLGYQVLMPPAFNDLVGKSNFRMFITQQETEAELVFSEAAAAFYTSNIILVGHRRDSQTHLFSETVVPKGSRLIFLGREKRVQDLKINPCGGTSGSPPATDHPRRQVAVVSPAVLQHMPALATQLHLRRQVVALQSPVNMLQGASSVLVTHLPEVPLHTTVADSYWVHTLAPDACLTSTINCGGSKKRLQFVNPASIISA